MKLNAWLVDFFGEIEGAEFIHKLLEEGLFVTINSDDPPMFNTTLTDEYLQIAKTFGFDINQIKQFVINGVRASLLSPDVKRALEVDVKEEFTVLEFV